MRPSFAASQTTKGMVAADLKAIYSAANAQSPELALVAFRDKWDNKYPTIGDIWQRNRQGIIPF